MPSSRPPQSFSTDLFRPEALAIIAQGKLASEKPHYRNLNSLPVGGFFVVIPPMAVSIALHGDGGPGVFTRNDQVEQLPDEPQCVHLVVMFVQ
jgi:hypothetical protein